MKKIILFIVLLCFPILQAIASCESGHWIQDKSDDGSVIILEDGSKWLISTVDRVDTALWLITDNITICPDEGYIINTDDAEKADATLIQ